jgi:hypothetical protein
MSDFLTSIGIKIPDLAAGFGGGVVNALFFKRGKPMDVVASVVGGAITANFLAQSVGRLCGTDVGVSGFIVGVTAMAICQGLLGAVKSKMQKLAEKPPDA